MVLAWLAALVAAGAAQPDPLTRSLGRDTSHVVRAARAAQDRFERDRRHRLPAGYASGGRCDERIGRFCYWYDDGDTALPAEPPPIRMARGRLLATLASAERNRPDSDWLVGQRVRYLIEQEESDSAIAAALRCGATTWWCDALGGMAHHAAGRFAPAESLFRAALAAMPEAIRCRWTDWTELLDDRLAGRSKRLSCAERAAFGDSLLWLGQPLWTRPGNDLATELYSRRVMASLHAVARSPHLIPWGADMEELMIRYGWSTRFSVSDRGLRTLEESSVIGHQRSPSYHFLPVDPDPRTGWRWDFSPDHPRHRYAPGYADRFGAPEAYQVARFPRGDSTVVVGAVTAEADTAFADRPLDLALAATAGPGLVATARRDSTTDHRALAVTVAGTAVAASLEVRPSGGRRYLRVRIPLPPPEPAAPILSDPLLFRVGAELPATLAEAAERALPTTRIPRGAPVGVYWELSGAGADSLDVAVAVIPVRRGFLGRIAQGLAVVGRKPPLTLQWRAGGDGTLVTARAVELDLARLGTGRFLLRLEARTPHGLRTTERTIELIP